MIPSKPHRKEIIMLNKDYSRLSKADSGKSVRTSFSLSEEAIEELEILGKQIDKNTGKRKTNKVIFNELCHEDVLRNYNNFQHIVASKKSEPLFRKSFVISQGTLSNINSYSRKAKISRDSLIESIIMAQQQQQINKKKRVSAFMAEFDAILIKMTHLRDDLENKDILNYKHDYEICDIFDIITDFMETFKESLQLHIKNDIPIDIPVSVPSSIVKYAEYVENSKREIAKRKTERRA
jgi:hypothetical protein